jgi:hypothetical protein
LRLLKNSFVTFSDRGRRFMSWGYRPSQLVLFTNS